ncbi:MAG: TRAP transporter substrate-binding protein [Cyclobacteriaceae bacterium]|nr:TRAP transporter substrate-binding protein [Cyclobacteriaceae bacterium]
MDKRKFLQKLGVAATAGVTGSLLSCRETVSKKADVPYINFNKTYRWKMTTTWPPNFPVVGEGCKMMADWVRKMSGGRMDITVYGGGELIPALEGFDAVSNGAIEMNHGAAYYWAGKLPAAQIMTTVPFGMDAQQMDAWIQAGGGDKIWQELYEPYGLMAFPAGNTAVQMGGWFNKEINSIQDLKGLKMRIPGLGGKVFARAGGTPMLQSGGEIYTNLERGVIDATEWIGPYHDYLMGFHQVAKYYYYPGWHEPGSVLELLVNKAKFEELPTDLQEIITSAALRLNRWMGAEFDAKNGEYLEKIKAVEGLELRRFPDDVLQTLQKYTDEIMSEMIESDPLARRVYEAFNDFRSTIRPWMDISNKIYYETMI